MIIIRELSFILRLETWAPNTSIVATAYGNQAQPPVKIWQYNDDEFALTSSNAIANAMTRKTQQPKKVFRNQLWKTTYSDNGTSALLQQLSQHCMFLIRLPILLSLSIFNFFNFTEWSPHILSAEKQCFAVFRVWGAIATWCCFHRQIWILGFFEKYRDLRNTVISCGLGNLKMCHFAVFLALKTDCRFLTHFVLFFQ